jgi:pimeloyl-ACP methyl ester carboxylesterase
MAISNIVLVHGGFVDGSGWQGVYDHLTADGYRVAVVQNPTLSLDGDVAATHQILDGLDGPAVLVGHSYGGVVITAAGNHPNVAALAYIAAFAPDKGESVSSLIADPPPGAPVPPILPPNNGFLFLDRDKFAASFAADVPAKLAGSWPTPRSRGAWTRSTEARPSRPGGPSRLGTSSPPTTT